MKSVDIEVAMRAYIRQLPLEIQDQAQRTMIVLLRSGCNTVKSLCKNIREEESETAIFACNILAFLKYKPAYSDLIYILKNTNANRELQRAAGMALGFLESKRAIRPLIWLLERSNDMEVRELAAFALGWSFDQRALFPLLRVLGNKNETEIVRAQAAEGLGLLADPKAVDTLIISLNDISPAVRFWSAYALGQCHAVQAIPELEKIAIVDQTLIPGWWSVSQEAREAIQEIQRWTKEHQ